MINAVRNSVLAILNKHNYGSIPVADFNEYSKMAQMEIFLGLFDDYNDVINNENNRRSGTGEADMRRSIEEAIDIFTDTVDLTHISANTFSMPTDAYKINDILVFDNGVFQNTSDYITRSLAETMGLTNLNTPSLSFPNHYIEGTTVTMLPSTINTSGDVKAEYVRFPADPKWTFVQLSGGEPVFNASANDYQDFELPKEYYVELIMKILEYTGLSIREADVVKYVQVDSQVKTMEKNN